MAKTVNQIKQKRFTRFTRKGLTKLTNSISNRPKLLINNGLLIIGNLNLVINELARVCGM